MPTELATFAGGCFWCTEAIFKRLKGVIAVTSGYSGGKRPNPTYDQIHSGATGHAEAIQIEFDPLVLPYSVLLDVFWHMHNPTTLNQQGADMGSEYRSVIFYHSDEQKKLAEESKKQLEDAKVFKDEIVTEIIPFTSFYKAEQEHQNFYENYTGSPYCTFVIDPKIKKLLEQYGNLVKDEYK